MVPDVTELLTPQVRKKFLGDRASLWGIVGFFVAAVAVIVAIVLLSPVVDDPEMYETLRKHGKFAEAEITHISAAIRTGSSRRHYSRGRVVSFRVKYRFSVKGKMYEGTHYVPASDLQHFGMKVGGKFLVLYDPKNPKNNVLTNMSASIIAALEETDQSLESLREKVHIPRGGIPSWILLILYFALVGAILGGGYWVWRRINAAKIFSEPVMAPALLLDREAVITRRRTSSGHYSEHLSGYKMHVKFVSHAGVPLDLYCTTRRRGEAAALRIGSIVTLIYEKARPKNFMIYELYGDRVVEWSEEELQQSMGDLYKFRKKHVADKEETIKPGRYGLGPSSLQEEDKGSGDGHIYNEYEEFDEDEPLRPE